MPNDDSTATREVSAAPPAEVAARLRIALARTSRRLRRQADQGHSSSVISALAVIGRHGPLTLGELAEAEAVSRPSMTAIAAKLVDLGLAARGADAEDRRLVRISITAAGTGALEASRSRKDAYLARRLGRLQASEVETLAAAAEILERLLEEEA